MKISFNIEYKNTRYAEIVFEQEEDDSSIEVYIKYMLEKNGEWEHEEICSIHKSSMEKLAKLFLKDCTHCESCSQEKVL